MTKYKLNTPYYSNDPVNGDGVKITWTWPDQISSHVAGNHDLYLYLQRSTTKSNWPLQPEYTATVGDQHVPNVEAEWETIKTWTLLDYTSLPAALYNDPITPTTTQYYRLVAFWFRQGEYLEFDWAPASIQPATFPPGTTVWGKSLISNGNGKTVTIQSAAVDPSGNVAVCGYYLGTVDFGGQTLVSLSTQVQYFVAKYTPTGSLIWVQGVTAGNGLSIPARTIAMDASGNVFTTGYFTVSITINGNTLTTTGFEDIFVFKHAASNGALSWYKQFGGTRGDFGRAVLLDTTQNPIIVGNFSDSITFGATTLTGGGGQDIFITKLSTADGSVTFAKGYGYTGDETVYSAATDSSGNIYICGQLIGQGRFETGGTVYTPVSAGDIFVVRYNSAGNYDSGSWVKQFGITGFNYAFGIGVDNGGTTPQVVVTGSFQASIDFGGGTKTALAGSSAFVLNLSSTGAHVWDQIYGGTSGGSDSGKSITVDANRNIVMCGTMVSTYAFGPTPDGGSILKIGATPDMIILKLNQSGQVLWVNRFGDTGFTDDALSAVVTSNANIIIAGWSNGSINIGNAGTFGSPYFNTQFGLFFKFQN